MEYEMYMLHIMEVASNAIGGLYVPYHGGRAEWNMRYICYLQWS